MNTIKAIDTLREWDKKGRYVFTVQDLAKLFPQDRPKAFKEGLRRLVQYGVLRRAARGVYVNPKANSLNSFVIEDVAKALRRGEYNYVSLESLLSEEGVISQIPLDRLTVMTTGRKGIYYTPYGVIEFTHTKRRASDIFPNLKQVPNRPLRIVSKAIALRDLRRVGRNLDLVDQELMNDE